MSRRFAQFLNFILKTVNGILLAVQFSDCFAASADMNYLLLEIEELQFCLLILRKVKNVFAGFLPCVFWMLFDDTSKYP